MRASSPPASVRLVKEPEPETAEGRGAIDATAREIISAVRERGDEGLFPTGLASRYIGGLWVGKFINGVTHQRLRRRDSNFIAPCSNRIGGMEACSRTSPPGERRLAKFGTADF